MLCCTGRRSQQFRRRHTPSFPRVHNGIRSRTRWKKDSKMILALSDSFRKLLSLPVLGSSMVLNCRQPKQNRQSKWRRSQRFLINQSDALTIYIHGTRNVRFTLIGATQLLCLVPSPPEPCRPKLGCSRSRLHLEAGLRRAHLSFDHQSAKSRF